MSTEIQLRRGRSATFQLDITRDGVALSLDGQKLIFTVARLQDRPASEALLRKVSAEGITHVPSVTGRALVRFSVEDTAKIDPLIAYFWDVAIEDESGELLPVEGLEGSLVPLGAVSAAA